MSIQPLTGFRSPEAIGSNSSVGNGELVDMVRRNNTQLKIFDPLKLEQPNYSITRNLYNASRLNEINFDDLICRLSSLAGFSLEETKKKSLDLVLHCKIISEYDNVQQKLIKTQENFNAEVESRMKQVANLSSLIETLEEQYHELKKKFENPAPPETNNSISQKLTELAQELELLKLKRTFFAWPSPNWKKRAQEIEKKIESCEDICIESKQKIIDIFNIFEKKITADTINQERLKLLTQSDELDLEAKKRLFSK